MFHLFSHCWSWLQAVQEPLRKVTLLIVGLDNAGKTTLVTELQRVLASEVLPTVKPGQTHLRVDRFEVTLLDLPGAQRARGAWRNHYGAAHGLLFVLDASARARMEEARKALARVLSHPKVSGKPLLLLANKQDEADALLPCELIECLSLEQLVNASKCPCRVVSARAGGGRR
ncbi:AR13B protein, partial [Crypturellus soui]|nr:AR13B protein [Crypturellus soui]